MPVILLRVTGRGRRRRGDRSRGTQLGSSPAHGRDESRGRTHLPWRAGRMPPTPAWATGRLGPSKKGAELLSVDPCLRREGHRGRRKLPLHAVLSLLWVGDGIRQRALLTVGSS